MTKYTGIKNGRRTIDVVNPEHKAYKRKFGALTRSVEVWTGRFEQSKESVKEIGENPTKYEREDLENAEKLMRKNLKELNKRKEELKGLVEPPAIIEKITDVVVPAWELRNPPPEQEIKIEMIVVKYVDSKGKKKQKLYGGMVIKEETPEQIPLPKDSTIDKFIKKLEKTATNIVAYHRTYMVENSVHANLYQPTTKFKFYPERKEIK